MNRKIIYTITIIWISLIVLPVSAQDDAVRNPYVIDAIKMYREGKTQEAIDKLVSLSKITPVDPDVFNALAVIYTNLEDYDKALGYFDDAIAAKENNFKSIFNKFNLLISLKRVDDAIAFMEQVVEDYPNSTSAWVNLGTLHMQKNELAKADECLRKAISIDPRDYDALFKLGQLQLIQKKYSEAEASFQKVLEINPGFSAAATGLSMAKDIQERINAGQYHVRLILVQDKETAEKVISELRAGSSFLDLVGKYSLDPSKSKGGNLGFVERGTMMKVLDDAVFSLEVGQVSDIVSTSRGFYIFMRVE